MINIENRTGNNHHHQHQQKKGGSTLSSNAAIPSKQSTFTKNHLTLIIFFFSLLNWFLFPKTNLKWFYFSLFCFIFDKETILGRNSFKRTNHHQTATKKKKKSNENDSFFWFSSSSPIDWRLMIMFWKMRNKKWLNFVNEILYNLYNLIFDFLLEIFKYQTYFTSSTNQQDLLSILVIFWTICSHLTETYTYPPTHTPFNWLFINNEDDDDYDEDDHFL